MRNNKPNDEASSIAAAVAVPHAHGIGSHNSKEAGLLQLVVAVSGIMVSFLIWGYLQEKLTTTPYGSAGERFMFPVFLLTVQSLFAATTGYAYLRLDTYLRRNPSSPSSSSPPPIIPSRTMLPPLLLVAFTSALAAPFGYAALRHIDYITFILAKSCKLLPVMLLHVTVFRTRYPMYKYAVVAAVTIGVTLFTLNSGGGKHKHQHQVSSVVETAWGLLLLCINLLFDGLTNSTQDYIFTTFKPYSGPQMMCANNMLGAAITSTYLIAGPWVARSALGAILLGLTDGTAATAAGQGGELSAALRFLATYPRAWADVLGFAVCGAVGQVFIFYTLSTFSSVLLVTVTVTRKMITMILSVIAFGHRLSGMQWLGVGLVFGGVGVEAAIVRKEKIAKQKQGHVGTTKVRGKEA